MIMIGAVGLALIALACSDAGQGEPPTIDAPVADDGLVALPEREGPRRQTTGTVPHVQVDPVTNPEVDAELRRRAFLLPGVEERASIRSLPGAVALWLSDDIELSRDDVLGGAREFAHFHPDGSLHVWLPVDRAIEVDATKWGEIHPWANRDGFWDGVVMVYVPETTEEIDIALRIIVDAYNFITGASVNPEQLR